jgi:predicted AAA+ superfamily ATPase
LRSGGILNQSELARDVKLPARTVGGYLDLLETSFVIERIPPFVRSRATRMLKSPKLYFADSGLACHLAGVGALDPAEPHRGAMLETWVAQNLRAILSAHLPRADLCFWHVQGRHEVDFVVSAGRSAVAIEVKGATRFDDRDLAGLRALRASSREVRAGILAYAGERTIDLGDDLYAIPLPLLVS